MSFDPGIRRGPAALVPHLRPPRGGGGAPSFINRSLRNRTVRQHDPDVILHFPHPLWQSELVRYDHKLNVLHYSLDFLDGCLRLADGWCDAVNLRAWGPPTGSRVTGSSDLEAQIR